MAFVIVLTLDVVREEVVELILCEIVLYYDLNDLEAGVHELVELIERSLLLIEEVPV